MTATTVESYLAALPEDRRLALAAVRQTILDHLPAGYQEGIQYGFIGYFVPHDAYRYGYHCDPKQPLPLAHIAAQKNHMAVYLFCTYLDGDATAQFIRDWHATGKKLDMGKSCVRFKKLDDLALPVIGRAIARWPVAEFIAAYERGLSQSVLKKRK